MPANVETAAYANTPAWHQEGEVLDTDGALGIDYLTALEKSGLDWEVAKVPDFAPVLNAGPAVMAAIKDGTEIPAGAIQLNEDRYNVQRLTDGKILGNVGATWQPIQNHEGFEILADVMNITTQEMFIEAAGALDGGRVVWILAHLAEDMQIAGEDIAQYLLFANGHHGRLAIVAQGTNVRVVCKNTLDYSIGKAKNLKRVGDMYVGPRQVRVRHTVNAGQRIKQAQQILGIRDKSAEALAIQGEWLADQSMSDAQFDKYLEKLMPFPDDGKEKSPARTMIQKRRDMLEVVYQGAENLKPIRGTRWGALQATTEYADYHREFKDSNSQLKASWGFTNSGQILKDNALQLLTATK